MQDFGPQAEYEHFKDVVIYLHNTKQMGRRKIAKELGVTPSKVRRWLKLISEEEGDLKEVSEEEINTSLFKQNQRLTDKNRISRRISREIVRIENAITEYSMDLTKIFKGYKLSKLTKRHNKTSEAVGIIHLSDAHFNEIVDIVGNGYNFKIAAQRMKLLADKAKVYLNALGVGHVLVAMTGDMLNSDRRVDEIMAQSTNRSRATFIAVDILQQFIIDINKEFNVSVACVTGNESRVKDEIGWTEQVASDNYDYTIFNILRLLFKDADGVDFVDGGCVELVVEVNGQNVLMLHGNGSIKSNVEKDVQGKMAPSKVEGIILGFKLEKERESRERQQNEPVE